MSSEMEQYNFVKGKATNEELEDYKECFIKNDSEKNIDNLKWMHQQNITGTNMIWYAIAKSTEKIAGIYTVLPAYFLINNKQVAAMQSIDTLTDSDHRGKGLFIKLAKKLYTTAEQNNVELVYGFPNGNSASGFFKKLEWKSFGEVPFLIKPLRFSYLLKKILKRKIKSENTSPTFDPLLTAGDSEFKIKLLSRFEKDYDELWQAVSVNIKVSINRNADYMNWRYVNKPGENYYKYGLYIKDKLSGIIVFAIKSKHDGMIGYLMELVYLPSNDNYGKKLIKFSTKIFRSKKTDVVLAWCTKSSFNYKAYASNYYFHFPPKLRPQDLFFGVRSFSKEDEELLYNIDNWYISYSDSDTV